MHEVEHEPFINLKPGSTMRSLTESFCQQAGFTPKVVFEGDDSSTFRGLITAGIGVGFISKLLLRAIPNPPTGVVLSVKEPRCQRLIGLTWRRDHYLSQAAQQFRTFVIQYFKNAEREV